MLQSRNELLCANRSNRNAEKLYLRTKQEIEVAVIRKHSKWHMDRNRFAQIHTKPQSNDYNYFMEALEPEHVAANSMYKLAIDSMAIVSWDADCENHIYSGLFFFAQSFCFYLLLLRLASYPFFFSCLCLFMVFFSPRLFRTRCFC